MFVDEFCCCCSWIGNGDGAGVCGCCFISWFCIDCDEGGGVWYTAVVVDPVVFNAELDDAELAVRLALSGVLLLFVFVELLLFWLNIGWDTGKKPFNNDGVSQIPEEPAKFLF